MKADCCRSSDVEINDEDSLSNPYSPSTRFKALKVAATSAAAGASEADGVFI